MHVCAKGPAALRMFVLVGGIGPGAACVNPTPVAPDDHGRQHKLEPQATGRPLRPGSAVTAGAGQRFLSQALVRECHRGEAVSSSTRQAYASTDGVRLVGGTAVRCIRSCIQGAEATLSATRCAIVVAPAFELAPPSRRPSTSTSTP